MASHLEEGSIDNESVTGRRVKHEPGTPAGIIEEDTSTAEATPIAASTRRRRGNTLQTIQTHTGKRKRSARGTSEAESIDNGPTTPGRPQSVMATRNFQRTSMTIMNDIQSHKHASLFSVPVRDKDAEGYSSMIKRPTDLKSIRTAIAAGTRAVNAVASTSDAPAGSPGASGSSINLPISDDLVPPKGIVNSAQLEREVMRMFANAVMFNPGDEEVVRDTREMFEDVDMKVTDMRSAERERPVREERDMSGGEEEGGSSGTVKRRKV